MDREALYQAFEDLRIEPDKRHTCFPALPAPVHCIPRQKIRYGVSTDLKGIEANGIYKKQYRLKRLVSVQ